MTKQPPTKRKPGRPVGTLRPSGASAVIHVRCTPDQKAWLAEAAAKHGLSISAHVVEWIALCRDV